MRLVDADDYLKSLQLAISVLEKKKRECDEVQQFGIDLSMSCIAATINSLAEQQTVESVPLSWWNELKDFLKSWKDDPWETITTSAIAELVLNKMNFIEEKGTEKQCF